MELQNQNLLFLRYSFKLFFANLLISKFNSIIKDTNLSFSKNLKRKPFAKLEWNSWNLEIPKKSHKFLIQIFAQQTFLNLSNRHKSKRQILFQSLIIFLPKKKLNKFLIIFKKKKKKNPMNRKNEESRKWRGKKIALVKLEATINYDVVSGLTKQTIIKKRKKHKELWKCLNFLKELLYCT